MRQNRAQKRTTGRCLIALEDFFFFARFGVHFKLTDTDRAARLQHDRLAIQSTLDFVQIGKEHAFAGRVDALTRGVVKTEHHVLTGNDGGIAVSREKHVVTREHQATRLELRFQRKRNVHGHLVAVEVGVKGRANERVQLDGFTFDELGLKGLNT